MEHKNMANKLFPKPQVVGTVHSVRSLKTALHLDPQAVDFFEVRVDAFVGREDEILAQLPQLKKPLIITVRDFREGGAQVITREAKGRLWKKFLPHAALIDVELISVKHLADIIGFARDAGKRIIISHHDFKSTPPLARLNAFCKSARDAGADILKVATVIQTTGDLAVLLAFQQAQKTLPLSLMGMGRFGKISRLLFAQAGSVLNYGYLDKPQVSGQWPAVLLRQRIDELLAD